MSVESVGSITADAGDRAARPRSFAARRTLGTEAVATVCASLFLFAMAAVGLAPERNTLDMSGWQLRGTLTGSPAR